ncbi:hypothetical protein HYH02_005577 [Chlamydomonas schloesseri]|uniref:Phosducin thioredoxin-like domain-containing protein n=1 Tax=Chlamydomonas schloesseri TaxID=2026947 RepID=A0A835WMI2_9CHLO|nr:hypothetical protein HYH02_005577 [Chlamydomonas schloesseri]|eukprot:KAG2449430.1 hypothetical protein HYH02_005577 [Chlamydomonas schloesseri]
MASAVDCCADTALSITSDNQTEGISYGCDATDAARFGLPDPSDLVDDPTLAGCCAEDLKNFRRAEKLRNVLLEVDPTMARLKLTGRVMPGPPPAALPEQQGKGSPLELTDEDEDDPELAELRARRLLELQRQAVERNAASSQGFGQLNDVPGAKLLETLEGVQGPAVVHVAVAGHEAGEVLDEHLAVLAYRHRGTFFGRVSVRSGGRGEPLAAQLRLTDAGLPCLVCFRGGAVVGRAPLSQFGPPGGLVEEEVTSYLQRLRVLRSCESRPQPGPERTRRRGGDAASDGSEVGDEEDEEEWRIKPCEVCGRRYPHEHVRAVYGASGASRRDGSDDEDD